MNECLSLSDPLMNWRILIFHSFKIHRNILETYAKLIELHRLWDHTGQHSKAVEPGNADTRRVCGVCSTAAQATGIHFFSVFSSDCKHITND